jgi:hypothetical protein
MLLKWDYFATAHFEFETELEDVKAAQRVH